MSPGAKGPFFKRVRWEGATFSTGGSGHQVPRSEHRTEAGRSRPNLDQNCHHLQRDLEQIMQSLSEFLHLSSGDDTIFLAGDSEEWGLINSPSQMLPPGLVQYIHVG